MNRLVCENGHWLVKSFESTPGAAVSEMPVPAVSPCPEEGPVLSPLPINITQVPPQLLLTAGAIYPAA